MDLSYAARFRKFSVAVESLDTEKIFLQSAKEQSELALDLNRLQLQTEHINAEGKSLGTYSKKSKKTGGRDLYLTGALQNKMFLDTKQIPIFIGSKDEKAPILTRVYGPIFGLTKVNQADFSNEVLIVYKEKTNEVIEALASKILS